MSTISIDTATSRPFVPLPSPFDRYHLTLNDRQRDPPAITRILLQPSVAGNLLSVPEPYKQSDADLFLNLDPHRNDEQRYTRSGLEWKDELRGRIPFTVIRDSETGELSGTVFIRRNGWQWLNASEEAKSERDQRVKRNNALPDGDATISYSIGAPASQSCLLILIDKSGFYLDPKLQGRGIMTAALETSIRLAQHYMGAAHIEGVCLVENIGSRIVFEKCGLRPVKEVDMLWKGGRVRQVLILRNDAA